MGHSIFFVVTEKDQLHRPESLFPEIKKEYSKWILDLSHLNEWDFMTLHPDLAGALSQLADCDALILNSTGPSLLPYLNKPAITFLTGWDLSNFANPVSIQTQISSWEAGYRSSPEGKSNIALLEDFIVRQRMGIQRSIAVRYFPKGFLPDDDQILEELGVSEAKRFFLYFSNSNYLKFSLPPNNQPVRVFCGARLTWKLPVESGRSHIDYKGGDIMVRGLGVFHRDTGVRLDIRLVRKGLHIRETEELISREGLGDQVTWLEEMPQFEYFKQLEDADIVFDQLGSSLPGLVSLDAMSIGRPVIANTRNLFSEFPEPSPICQATTPEEVCAQLKHLVLQPQERELIGKMGRRYAENFLSPENSAREIEKKIIIAIQDSTGQESPYGTDFSYILKLHVKMRKDFVHHLTVFSKELERTKQELAWIREKLDNSQQELFRARDTIAHHERFLKPFRFLINLIKKFQ